jgi:hypothetical protein
MVNAAGDIASEYWPKINAHGRFYAQAQSRNGVLGKRQFDGKGGPADPHLPYGRQNLPPRGGWIGPMTMFPISAMQWRREPPARSRRERAQRRPGTTKLPDQFLRAWPGSSGNVTRLRRTAARPTRAVFSAAVTPIRIQGRSLILPLAGGDLQTAS